MTTRVEMLHSFPQNLQVCEAGVRWGNYSKYLYEILKPKILHLIDMKETEQVNDYIRNKQDIKYHICKFNEAVPLIKKLDLVYIDGMHDYDSVIRDLNDFDKITSRWICGHDWVPEREYNFKTHHDFRVREAVTDWIKDKPYMITFITDDLSNILHDPDAKKGKNKLYSYVISKTKEDHVLFHKNLKRWKKDV